MATKDNNIKITSPVNLRSQEEDYQGLCDSLQESNNMIIALFNHSTALTD
jgi:hypothetical protein